MMSSKECSPQQEGANPREPLCPVCSTVSSLLSTYHTKVDHDGPIALVWTLRIRELVTAAEGGCEYCWFITKTFFTGDCSTVGGRLGLERQKTELEAAVKRKDEVQRASERVPRILQKVEDDSFKFSLVPQQRTKSQPDIEKMMIKMRACTFDERTRRALCGPRTEIFIEVFAKEGDPAARFITSRPLNTKPSSPESFEKARLWIRKCTEEHLNCPKLVMPQLPTRVVDVSAADRNFLRLHEGGGKEHYAVLSYVSGGPQPFATTSETISSRVKGFSKSGLPPTLQDAVTVTQEMDLKYLWVDSLCTLHDSQDGNDIEVSNMVDIYKNAYFTISAACAETCNDGFLGDRGTRSSFEMPYVCPDGVLGTIVISREETYNPMWEPISRDARTLQARLLSPRLLIYGSRFIWQCQSAQHSDGGIEDWESGRAGPGQHRLPSKIFAQAGESNIGVAPDLGALRKSWYATVQEYTRRKLAEPGDILPAIAGIASQFQALNNDVYLAGMWKSSLAHELMWTAHKSVKRIPAPEWRAPSWSWASVENAVSFVPVGDSLEFLAKIINSSMILASESAPFGQVTGGELTIKGPLKQVEWPMVEKLWEEGAPLQLSSDERTRNIELMTWAMAQMSTQEKSATAMQELQTLSNAWLLMMFRGAGYWSKGAFVEKPSFSGLVLEETGTGSYKRIGVFFNKYEEWMEGWEPQTITIE